MNTILLQRLSVSNLPWWRVGFYILYLIVIQIANSGGETWVNALIGIVMISIIEVSQHCLKLLFFHKRYGRALLIGGVNYISLAIAAYYTLHVSDNAVSAQIWNKDVDASWMTFLGNFNKFYLTFVKYAIIFTLVHQVLTLVRKKVKKEKAVEVLDVDDQQTDILSKEQPDQFEFFYDGDRIIKFKAGTGIYVLDIFTIVHLKVNDDITTIYRVSGAPLEVKIPLSKFYEWLPEDKFFQINKSRIIAIRFFHRETNGHIYLSPYEDEPLKLGDQKRYSQYKTWKEKNLRK